VRGFFELRSEHRDDAFGVRQNIVVPDSDDAIARGRELSITMLIGNTVGVLSAIDFDDHSPLAANEVDHVWADRLLPRKFESAEAAIA